MKIHLIRKVGKPIRNPKPGVYLAEDKWNDFGFITMFYVSVITESGKTLDIGNVKIGLVGQSGPQSTTINSLSDEFDSLDDRFFSLGQELEYYQNIRGKLSNADGDSLLSALQDVAFVESQFSKAETEKVFVDSLMRSVSASVIGGQFRRVIRGGAALTDFKFEFEQKSTENTAGVSLSFLVTPESKPSTNVHAIIGRNGVGKTTILNAMVASVAGTLEVGGFRKFESFYRSPLPDDYFSSLVSVTFSAFDPFEPPANRTDPAQGTCYYYVGLKTIETKDGTQSTLKDRSALDKEFFASLNVCLSQDGKRTRWLRAITALESDENFAQMKLPLLADKQIMTVSKSLKLVSKMSSGHAIVLLSITKLVETIEEKTLVLIDEPESHLHPPLLSAFIRALSELLHDRNGVAIIATHSPVVLQEVPSSCVWKITRSGLALSAIRPEIETFGENVGVLTREVFGLEVEKSGFHNVLANAAADGASFEEVLESFGGQLGFEAQAILRSVISTRDLAAN
jgi:predicted ATPase